MAAFLTSYRIESKPIGSELINISFGDNAQTSRECSENLAGLARDEAPRYFDNGIELRKIKCISKDIILALL